jgi:hypothetical protein
MIKAFWKAIKNADFAVPAGRTVQELTPQLLSLLGSTDPELRDELAIPIIAHWVHREQYSPTELRSIIARLTHNLTVGLGDVGTDAVFLRSFSALALAELVNYSNKHPFLDEAEVRQLLYQSLTYLGAEEDLRGYVTGSGWAHAIAHTADLLMVLARNINLGAPDIERLMSGIAARITNSGGAVFVHDEDERLVNSVIAALQRNLLPLPFVDTWLDQFAHPAGRTPWEQAFQTEPDSRAYYNTKAFLRSLYLRLMKMEAPPAVTPVLLPKLKDTLQTITPYF